MSLRRKQFKLHGKATVFLRGIRNAKVKNENRLSSLSLGQTGEVVSSVHPSEGMARRLSELGFTEGTAVKCVGVSPGGGMKAYSVLGAVIAIRDVDAEYVVLKSAIEAPKN